MAFENIANAEHCTQDQKNMGCATVTVESDNTVNYEAELNYTPCAASEFVYRNKAPNGKEFCAQKGTQIGVGYESADLSWPSPTVGDNPINFICTGKFFNGPPFGNAHCKVKP